MDKKQIVENFKSIASEAFMKQLEINDRNCGTSASLNEGMEVTLKQLEYFDGKRIIGEDAYAKVPNDQRHRYIDNGNGTYTVDNSYYGVSCQGAVSAISFRTLTSAAQAPEFFKNCLMIAAGKASVVGKSVEPFLGKTLVVSHVESWKAGEEWNGRVQAFDGKAVGFALKEEKKGK